MLMIIGRGNRNGRYADKMTLRSCNLDNVIETLETVKKRMDLGIEHMGTEVKMIQVASWRNPIRCPEDVQQMLDYYKAYEEVRG